MVDIQTGESACPFCGGVFFVVDKQLRDGYADCKEDPDAHAYSLRCNSCAAVGGWSKSESGARRMWNMRPTTPTKDRP